MRWPELLGQRHGVGADATLVTFADGAVFRDAAWVTSEKFGAACIFEGDAVPFGQIGYGERDPARARGLRRRRVAADHAAGLGGDP